MKASKDIVDPATASIWWAGKELQRDKKLGDYVGKNDKTKIIAKLQKVKLPEPRKSLLSNFTKCANKVLMLFRKDRALPVARHRSTSRHRRT